MEITGRSLFLIVKMLLVTDLHPSMRPHIKVDYLVSATSTRS